MGRQVAELQNSLARVIMSAGCRVAGLPGHHVANPAKVPGSQGCRVSIWLSSSCRVESPGCRVATPNHATLVKRLYAVQHYTEMIDSATRQPSNLASPDHATLVMHLYAVQHYTQIFNSAARQPSNLASPDHATLVMHLYAVQHYTQIFEPATWQPGHLASPDHATLVMHLYAVQHYTQIFNSATRQHGDPRSCNLSYAFICSSTLYSNI